MALTDSQRGTLSRKATDGRLEVEDLLRVAVTGGAADVPFLRSLEARCGWSYTGKKGRGRVVPLGRWSEVVCRFLEGGCNGLVRLSRESTEAPEFCLSVLESVRTPESVAAVAEIAGQVLDRPQSDVRLATRLAEGFNRLLSGKGGPAVGADVERRIREFLHRLLALDLTEAQRASAVCALRGVGDEESLAVIAAQPPLRGCWAGVETAAARAIRLRLRRLGTADPV